MYSMTTKRNQTEGLELTKLYSLKPGLKAARKAAHMTQQQLADQFNVSLKTVMNWEQGLVNPDLEDVYRLADLLHCDIDFLTGRISCQTHDLQYVHDLTGLSEDAIKTLISMNEANRVVHRVDILSRLIVHRSFPYLLSLLPADAAGTMEEPIYVNDAYISNIDRQAVVRSELKSTIDKIADDLRAQMPPYDPAARMMQGIAFNLWKDGRLTDDQYKQTVAAYDKGDYEFIPEGFTPRRPDR